MEKEINGIVLNRMYSGEYLRENLGHEVINLYQADNGNHYLYLLDYGTFDRKYKEKINYMLMIRYIDTAKYKIIGLACGLTDTLNESDELIFENQEHFHSNGKESVCYGGVNVFDIFKLNQSYQDTCITYKAEEVFVPKQEKFIEIDLRNSSKQYFMPTDERYEEFYEIIKDESLWEKTEKKVDKFNAKTKAEKREVIEEASIKILEGRVALFNNVEQKNE